jgi:phosphohistidine swiveling domain-containing protein
MTRTMMTISQLSETAQSAVLAARGSREGAAVLVPAGADGEALYAELAAAGVIGERRGLTRSGALVRERLLDGLLTDLL